MNPSNPFGRPQGGAFQAPNNPMKTSLFGQQSANSQPQTMDVFQSSAFGQSSGLAPSSSHGNAMFGQNSGFMQQNPVFGQTSVEKGPVFGSNTAQAFSQTAGQNQSSVFGQSAAFEPTPVFGQKTPEFGGFGQPPTSTTAARPAQSHGFGQPLFGQPSSTGATSVFGGNTVTQSKSFAPSTFSFKPASEALFKPIFSASPEPNPQTTSTSSSPFSSSVTAPQTSSTCPTTGSFGLPGFRFSVPVAAPSSSTANNPLTAGNNGGSTNTVQFTFSQPAPPSSSSTTNSTATQPTTPSSFSFSLKPPQAQTLSLTEGSSLVQRPIFGNKGQSDTNTDKKGNNFEALEETNVFARLGKGVKRKEDPFVFSSNQEKTAPEDVPVELEPSRHPPKRPLMRSHHLPGGIFGRVVSGLRKESDNLAKRDAAKETQHQVSKWEEAKGEDAQSQDDLTAAPQATAFATKDTLEKDTESDSANDTDPQLGAVTSVRRERRESSDSLSNASFTDCTVLQCRKIPPSLNKKNIIEKHFSRFGQVSKVICRPAKNLAIVHFKDHASAAKAKKKGKSLHQNELFLLWQRKKHSPEGKTSRSIATEEEQAGEGQEDMESTAMSHRRSLFRPSGGSSTATVSHSSPVKRMATATAKSLQFTAEPQRETGTEPQTLERPVPSSLVHLIGQVAETAEDKYRLLEQRDKVLRQGRPKRTDLNLSKVFVGTCPDMCPEKERYMRETRNQLSVFEVIPDTEMVDHTAAIKEYSRSSADQEEPLPHDLRPLPVLSMTMDYLVTQIMNQDHENQRDWYDFVWNRTRGIRKDITQQRLCCPHTVSLIEKCARFHVHCAHHLCEEQMSSFDAKINNENLTKCMQSLKEMYQDLATQQIYCPQEAEFRQYSVLLKLNDGDILREVQQFRDEVRNSAEVKFAVQAFASVSSNNFVRFFKLVKGASYLASCILHRYFNQVRTKGLKCLNIAHTVGTRSTAFPLEDITRMFMFRSMAEATEFIHQYSLNVIDGMVELNRTNYQEPELLSQKKSDFILLKKKVLTGEVVNGGALPNPPQHVPVCSFDSKNKFSGEVPQAEPTTTVTAKVEVSVSSRVELLSKGASILDPVVDTIQAPAEVLRVPLFTPEPQPAFQLIHQPVKLPSPPPPAPPPPVYTDEEIMSELDTVIEEVVTTSVREIADAGDTYVKTALGESSVQVESLVMEVLGQMLQEVSSEEIKAEELIALEKYRQEQIRLQEERKALLFELSISICNEIVDEVTDEILQQTSSSEIQHAVDEKAQQVARCTEEVCNLLIEDTLAVDIGLIVEETLDAELQQIQKYIKRWRDVVAVRRHLKRQMRGFPAAPCCVDPRFKLKALVPSAQPSVSDISRNVVNLGNAGTLALSTTRSMNVKEEVMHQMRVHYFNQLLMDEMVWAPLQLPALVTESMTDPPDRIFWKLTLLLPSNQENATSPADKILSEWLEVKLGGEGSEDRKEESDGTMKTLFVTNTQQERGANTHRVHISVQSCRGPLSEGGLSDTEKNSELNGTSALMMLLPVMSIMGRDDDVFLLSALLQLKQLQQASTWRCPLPLIILVPGSAHDVNDQQKLEEALMLQALVQEDLILEYKFFFIPETTSDIQGSKQLSCALDWLLARAPPTFPLSCQSLMDLVEATVSQEFTARVDSHCREFAPSGLHFQDPAAIILLYNAVLAHIADAVSSKDLLKLSWPPGELCLPENRQFVPPMGFNSPQHLAWLREAILSLQLPQWGQLSTADTWTDLCLSVYSFAAQIPVSSHSQPLLMSRLENLLENVRLKQQFTKGPRYGLDMRSWIAAEEEMECPCDSLVPWEDVLIICIDHKLKDWQIPKPAVCAEDGEILVYFSPESLKGFQPPEEWRLAVRQKRREREQQQEEEKKWTGAAACYSHTKSSLSLRQNLFHSAAEPPESRNVTVDITQTLAPPELLAHKLLQSVEAEKAESRRSMEQLQRWVDGDTLDPLSTPLFVPSSTLLSMPRTILQPQTRKSRDSGVAQESDDLLEQSVCPKNASLSLKWQMKELERQILASREEELACGLELSSLFNIVND